VLHDCNTSVSLQVRIDLNTGTSDLLQVYHDLSGTRVSEGCVEADNRKIALIESFFDENAEIHTKESGSGKYISITSKQVAMNVDEIIDVYKKAAEIKGIMFL
jgi:hypothetical protein